MSAVFNVSSMQKFENLIKSRRTVHQFTNEKISEDLVINSLELSLWVPNHRLTFPWKYFLIEDETRARLIDLAVQLKRAKDPSFSEIKAGALKKRLAAPSHWVFLGVKKDENDKIFEEDKATVACSVQTISLDLWKNNIATKWSTGAFSQHEKTYEILKVNSKEIYLMGVLFIGVAERTPPTPERPPIGQFLERK